jgi:NAD-dependent SIR2 family protein deacetylase
MKYIDNKFDHRTGRKCNKCGGDLYDSIINFKENLPEKALKDGFEHAEQADVCLVMGSSLRVSPACNMAENVIIFLFFYFIFFIKGRIK